MNQAQRLEAIKYHKALVAAYRACGQESLAKIEEGMIRRLVRESYKVQAARA